MLTLGLKSLLLGMFLANEQMLKAIPLYYFHDHYADV